VAILVAVIPLRGGCGSVQRPEEDFHPALQALNLDLLALDETPLYLELHAK
jgi:hypothetical protein